MKKAGCVFIGLYLEEYWELVARRGLKGARLVVWPSQVDNEPSLKNSVRMSLLTVSERGGMSYLCLKTIRGSFLIKNSDILMGFWTRYQWNFHENPYFFKNRKVSHFMPMVGVCKNRISQKDLIFEDLSNKTKITLIHQELFETQAKKKKFTFFFLMSHYQACSL